MGNGDLQKRDGFSTKIGVIAAAAGSAIGLGNIWKFPYITGENGGSAFIIVYLVCIAIIGVPLMLAEFLIGRSAQLNSVGSFKKLAAGTKWHLVGWMGVIAAFCILAYYGVVAGWTIAYVIKALTNTFAALAPAEVEKAFGSFIGDIWPPIMYQLIFMALTCWIVLAGVKSGIEKYSKILMPILLGILVVLCIRSVTLPGASKGLSFLFKPDFGSLKTEAILIALGHAFFSLSLGMGTMVTYGSYIRKKENLGKTALQVSIADTLIALLAGIAIFPAVFAFSIEASAGPGLVFITIPNVFKMMAGGYIFSIMFFVLLAVAALTSSISVLEVIVAFSAEELKLNRKKATIISTIVVSLIGIPCSLSFSSLSGATLPKGIGILKATGFAGKNFFDILDHLAANYLLPLGGLCIVLFVGWFLGKDKVTKEVTNEGTLKVNYVPLFVNVCKFIAPVAIAFVFLYSIGILKFN
jgi:NSS family neurotransmitter:Na+ symporter